MLRRFLVLHQELEGRLAALSVRKGPVGKMHTVRRLELPGCLWVAWGLVAGCLPSPPSLLSCLWTIFEKAEGDPLGRTWLVAKEEGGTLRYRGEVAGPERGKG